jgi:hypothetical protein
MAQTIYIDYTNREQVTSTGGTITAANLAHFIYQDDTVLVINFITSAGVAVDVSGDVTTWEMRIVRQLSSTENMVLTQNANIDSSNDSNGILTLANDCDTTTFQSAVSGIDERVVYAILIGYDAATEIYDTWKFQVYAESVYGSGDAPGTPTNLYALKSEVLTLDNTTAFTPDANYEPATKKYVDDNVTGESNTASNVGTGVGIYKQKTGVDLELKKLKSTDSSVTIASATSEVNLTVVHNNTGSLDSGDYLHLTSAQKTVATQEASTTVNGYLSTTKWDEIVANTAKVTNVSSNLSEGTSTETTVDVNSSDGTNATLVSASTSRAGLLTKAKWDEVVANTAKDTNVSTNLSEGTSTETTVDVNSSDGTNATLVAATTSRAGLLTKALFDTVVANKDVSVALNLPSTLDTTSTTALATIAKFPFLWNLGTATITEVKAKVLTAVSTGTEPSINVTLNTVNSLSADLDVNETLATGSIDTGNDDIVNGQYVDLDFDKGNGDAEDLVVYLKFTRT